MRTSWIRKALFGPGSRTLRRANHRNDSTTSPQLERLEDRLAPATIVWKPTGTGTFDFAFAGNWVGNVVPGPNDIASFTDNILANETINFTSAVTLQGIRIGDADNTNSFSLTGSTITLNAASGIVKGQGTGSTNTTADTIANAITLGANFTALENDYASASLSLGGILSGAFSVKETGIGTVVLGGANTYSGGTSIVGGTLSISGDANLGASAGGIQFFGGTLQFTGAGVANAIAATRTITINSSGGTIDTSGLGTGSGNQTSIAANITGTGPLTLNAHGDTSDSGGSSDSYLTLTGTNNFLGNVTISSGVVFAADASFGNTVNALTLSGGGLVALFSTTIARAVTLSGSGVLRTYGGTNVTFSGPIGGTGTLRKTDGGTAILTGTENYSGGTSIGGGTLQIGNGAAGSLGSGAVTDNGALVFDTSSNVTVAGVISGAGSLTQAGSGTTDLKGGNTFTGPTTISSGILQLGNGTTDGSIASQSIVDNATLDFNDANALTYGGTISGTGTLNKSSGGTLTLTGASGNVSVTVSAGTLAGSGSTGALSVASGTIVAPGGATGSAILSTGAVSFVSGSTFHVNINGTTAGSGYDQLNVTGAVNLGGATLAIVGSLVPTAGSTFVLVSNDAGDPIVGTFNNLPEGAIVSNNFQGSGLSARITYVGGGGNDVAIIVNTPPAISPGLSLYQGPQIVGFAGTSVAADSVYTVVAVPNATVNGAISAGMAYVYSTATGALVRKLKEPTPGVNDQFGHSVAVSGTTVVVGAVGANSTSGAAYVFNAATGALVATLTEPSPAINDQFGEAVAVSGTTVVVGAPNSVVGGFGGGIGGVNGGRAYVIDATTGAFIDNLTEPTPAAGDQFGVSVAVSGTTVVVGAPGNGAGGAGSGKAYVFNAATGLPTRILAEPIPAANDEFGQAVAVAGTTAVVGAPGNSAGGSDSGRVYVMDAATGALAVTLSEPSPAANDNFGQAVAVSGTTVVVGVPDNQSAGTGSGRAYIFSGLTGALVNTLTEPMPAANDLFGAGVAISGTTVVVGAPHNGVGGPFSGQAYVFSAAAGAFVAALATPSQTANDDFGLSVAVSGTTLVVGASGDSLGGVDSGRAYVYSVITGALVATLAEPSPAANDRFGASVAVSGTTVVVGADGNSTGGFSSGRAYVFSATTGMLVATLAEPSPAANDHFGYDVAVSGTTVVVGAYRNSAGGTDSGRAYVFSAVTGALVATLAEPSPASGDLFGASVAVSGTTVVVGADGNDTGATDSGRAYVFNAATGALVATLAEPSPAAEELFGYDVAVSGTTIAVGAPGSTASGRAYLFSAITGSFVAALAEPSPAANDMFGNSVTVSGTTVVVGAYGNSTGGTDSGRAYVFSAATGALVATLAEPSPAANDLFGYDVAVSGTTVVVGAPFNSTFATDQGAAYVQYGVDVADSTTAVTTVAAFDPDLPAQSLTYSIVPVASGGAADAAKFQINANTGALSFVAPPSFPNPTDAGGDNIYNVTVQASDGAGGTSTRTIAVQVQSVATNQPTVYVDGDWSSYVTGTVIADADPTQTGNQPATFGVNAFANLQGAADAVASGGTITLLAGAAGAYPLSAALANPFSLNVPTGTVTVSGKLSGAAAFAKAGNGTLILSGANTFAGGVAINAGKVQVATNANLGAAANSVTVSAFGELNFTGSTTTSRTFTLSGGTLSVNSGQTLTLSSATIGGGFLKGPGAIATSAGASAAFFGVTAQNSIAITAKGSDSFVNFTNNGSLTIAAGQTVSLTGFTNQAAGVLTIIGAAGVSDFTTYGQMTVSATGSVTNAGSSGFTFAGGSVTTIAAGGSVNIGMADALVEWGLVANAGDFGSTTNNVVVDFGGLVHGTGTFHSVITENGGVYSPGNSPGPANLSSFPVNGGGIFEFDISDATGTAGNVDGWDTATVAPNLYSPTSAQILLSATAANPYTIDIDSLLNDGAGKTAGPAAEFDPTQGYAWKFIDGAAAGTTVSGMFDPAAFSVVTTGFSNAFTGMFSVALGDAGKNLYVVYSPSDYVDNVTWTGLAAGTLIPDADPTATGNQAATLGETAFTRLPDAVHAAPAGGTVEMFPGTYPDAVVLTQAVTLNVSQAGVTVSGAIAGTGPLVKTGTGPLTLTGADTCTGSTTVSAGTLLVDGSIASSIVVSAGATLGGTGTIGGSLASSGVVAPGDAGGSNGTLTTGNLTLGPGALVLDLSSSGSDSVNATGSIVNISGTTLSLSVDTIMPGESFAILTVPGTSSGVLQGSFANLPNTGSSFSVGTLTFTINYAGGDGNDVTLTASGISPSIVSTVLNGGIAYVDSTLAAHQHSMVENVVFSFSQAVTLSASNFTLSGFQGTPISPVPNVNVSGSGTAWTVTFSGVGVNSATHSIGDGEYQLVLSDVPGLASNTFDFFRLLGDMDGDGTVSASDYSTLISTFLRPASDPFYLGAVDFDGDNTIGASDLSQFTANFLHTVPTPLPN